MSAPATVRNHNPSAQYPGISATKYGALGSEHLNDGLNNGSGNEIAVFPDNVHGAAAQFDLLKRVYVGMTVRDAIAKWCGGNGVDSYLEIINEDTGLDGTDRLTLKYLSNPKTGIPFAQAMARQETGYIFPMTDGDWRKAHQLVFGSPLIVGASGTVADADAFNNTRPATLGERILHRTLSHLGERRIDGPENNQDIIDYAHVLGRNDITNDDFPYCAAGAGAMMSLEGAQVPPPDDALLARSYLKVGQTIYDTSDLQPGDIAIWPRAGGMGHVNIVESYDPDTKTVVCVGFNQEGGACTRAAPRSIEEALGFTRPVPSKLRPDGTKSIRDTVGESTSLRMFIQAKLAAAAGGIAWVINSLTGDMAGTATQVSGVMAPAKGIVAGAGIPLTTEVLFGLTAIIICSIAYRQLKQRQTQPQRQTIAG